jgi:hypothetical protein
MITLAPFYRDVDLGQESQKLIKNSGVVDYRACLHMLVDTLYRTNPGCDYRICTDQQTPLDFPSHKIFRSDLAQRPLLESLVVSNTEFVHQHQGRAVLCGSDHLLANSMSDIFNDDFDICLLFSGDEINNTAVLINTNLDNHHRVREFFDIRQQAFYDLPADRRLWLGDQISYRHALRHYDFPGHHSELIGHTHRRRKLNIKFIEYNVDFVWGAKKSGTGYYRNAVLVDFKGPRRKQWFVPVYRKIMGIDIE